MPSEVFSVFWSWLRDTSPGQATFIGSVFGFLALLGGAWANAWFNRRRDDRLRREEQRAVATALRAELAGCRSALLTNSQELKKGGAEHFVTPDLAHAIRIMPHMIPKFGLLDEETIDKVANAYLAIEEHGGRLLLFGERLVDPASAQPAAGKAQPGTRRLMSIPEDKTREAIAINTGVAGAIGEAIDRLDVFLRSLR